VVAAADGWITRSTDGQVVQDLDDDGKEQTGWSLLYMHIETRDRVERGTVVKKGDHIGHPSCEGGVSTGTHLHFARRYNGTWIAADGDTPFKMDGWISSGQGLEYDGALTSKDKIVEAWDGRKTENEIQR
jgi:murein DD-endopeptidase MepM/ murein hydrolase activator NlpD